MYNFLLKCLVQFALLELFVEQNASLTSELAGYFSQRTETESSTKLNQAKTKNLGIPSANDHVLHKLNLFVSVLLLIIKISQSAYEI